VGYAKLLAYRSIGDTFFPPSKNLSITFFVISHTGKCPIYNGFRNYRDGRKRIIEAILSTSSISEKGCKLDKVVYICLTEGCFSAPETVLAPCVSEKTRSVIGMETKPASKRQLAYIRRLQTVVGEAEPEITEEMSVSEASEIISELIARVRQNGVAVQKLINEPRLGMAMKECFRQWSALGRSIHDERRRAFIDYTIDTYNLFTEIAENLGQAQ